MDCSHFYEESEDQILFSAMNNKHEYISYNFSFALLWKIFIKKKTLIYYIILSVLKYFFALDLRKF